jgi:hypothetical protein
LRENQVFIALNESAVHARSIDDRLLQKPPLKVQNLICISTGSPPVLPPDIFRQFTPVQKSQG